MGHHEQIGESNRASRAPTSPRSRKAAAVIVIVAALASAALWLVWAVAIQRYATALFGLRQAASASSAPLSSGMSSTSAGKAP